MSPWSLVRDTAPTVDPVTTAEVRDQANIGHQEDDSYIDQLISRVTDYLDGAEGILGRCLVSQTWDLNLDWFPPSNHRITIPLAPLISVTSITYTDENGSGQTLSASNYQVVGVGSNVGGYIVESYNNSWPATRDIPESVVVKFVAGYAESGGDARANIPAAIKHAIVMMVADLYQNRETVGPNMAPVPMPASAMALLAPYRRKGFA